MKKIGLLHGELSKAIALMAHHEEIMIGDAGMPVPKGVPLIDLALVEGIPSFLQVLEAVLRELAVEHAYIDTEMSQISPQMRQDLDKVVADAFPLEAIPHEELKKRSEKCKLAVRSAEFTPYSNIILKAGVLF